MIYQLFIEKSAQKSLSKIPSPHQDCIINKINKLSAQPRPVGAMKLSGREAWRIRIGSYRVIYEINDDKLTVLVVTLGHRKDIYAKGISYETDIGEKQIQSFQKDAFTVPSGPQT